MPPPSSAIDAAPMASRVDLFERVAVRWSQVLGAKVTPAQVLVCLIDLKVARLTHDPRHLDSITDVAGYAACLAEVLSDA